MKTLLMILVFILSSTVFAGENYGKPFSLKSMPLSLADAIKSPSDSPVLLKAKVGKVCKKKGCWMSLESQSGQVRVTFENYGFFVPITLVGKNVLLEGVLKSYKMSLKETKHYIQDEGGNPEKVTKARTEFRVVATSVKVTQ
ncbi:MAG: DUF4920 domain-containing protein [Bacteriovoracaceae bacterium]|jgi:hypothetical protein|nr:DUF4920 domain-containing protein [Bacteriovoracaceae bacterium]